MRFILLLLVTAFLTVSVIAALMFILQHALIYHPRQYPAGFERLLPRGAVQLRSTTGAGLQVAFYVPPRSRDALPERVWVAFSGNASVALDWLYFAEQDPNDSDAFLLVDYPGYGLSQGRPDIASNRASSTSMRHSRKSRCGQETITPTFTNSSRSTRGTTRITA